MQGGTPSFALPVDDFIGTLARRMARTGGYCFAMSLHG